MLKTAVASKVDEHRRGVASSLSGGMAQMWCGCVWNYHKISGGATGQPAADGLWSSSSSSSSSLLLLLLHAM